MRFDGRSLVRKLLSVNTVNPPGKERDCSQFFGYLLEQAGYETHSQEFAENRSMLIAWLGASGAKPPLCFTGLLDMVPLGVTPWARRQRDFMSCS